MAINWILPVRGLQAALAVAVLGLMSYVASWWSSHWRQVSPAEINFMIFAPVWTVLSLVPLILLPLKWPYMATGSPGKFLLLALECVTMLYWFSGFIALAVFLSDRICFGTVCSVAKAGTAISAFQWVAFAATVVGGVMSLFKKHGGVAREPKVEMHQGV